LQFREKLRIIGQSLLPHCCQRSSRPATRLANTIHTTNWLPKISPLTAPSPSFYIFLPLSLLPFILLFSSLSQMWKFSNMQSQNSYQLRTVFQSVPHSKATVRDVSCCWHRKHGNATAAAAEKYNRTLRASSCPPSVRLLSVASMKSKLDTVERDPLVDIPLPVGSLIVLT
jgi:hypothetical protein